MADQQPAGEQVAGGLSLHWRGLATAENHRAAGAGATECSAPAWDRGQQLRGVRYWHPFTESAVADIKADDVDEVVVLPLYPYFSISTTGSSFRELQRLRQADPVFAAMPIRCIRSYHDDQGYIDAMAGLIAREIQACPDPDSAHGVPKSYVEEAGDPYQGEIETCARLIIEKLEATLGHSNYFTLAYQSRVGPVEWLKPYTDEALEELGRQGVKDLVVVPISFVSEHIETLEEIDIEYRKLAFELDITNFRRVPALDTNPAFIHGLARLVQHSLDGPEVNLDQAAALPSTVKLYPQDKWAWGWNNSSEVWNGRLAMFGFSAFVVEIISGQGPSTCNRTALIFCLGYYLSRSNNTSWM